MVSGPVVSGLVASGLAVSGLAVSELAVSGPAGGRRQQGTSPKPAIADVGVVTRSPSRRSGWVVWGDWRISRTELSRSCRLPP